MITSYEGQLLKRVGALRATIETPGFADEQWWLCRWEATDLYSFIFDTQKLSVIRGASQLVEMFGRCLEEIIAAKIGLDGWCIVYAAAGQATVLIKGRDRAEEIGKHLVASFREDPVRGRSGYAVCRVKPDTIDDATPALTAMEVDIFAQRMRNLDVDPGDTDATLLESPPQVDPYDGKRARSRGARGEIQTKDDTVRDDPFLSRPNATRFRFGQEWRWGLTEELAELRAIARSAKTHYEPVPLLTWRQWLQIASDANAGSSWPNAAWQQDFNSIGRRSNLPGYIAVLEGDGNGFTKYRRAHAPGLIGLGTLSVALHMVASRALAAALRDELDELLDASGDGVQLCQLLVRAGDELTLVVPADRAVRVVERFHSAWRKIAGDVCDLREIRDAAGSANAGAPLDQLGELTFGFGVVAGHASAPIRHLRNTASELLQLAKSAAKNAIGPGGSAWTAPWTVDWMICQSHDVQPEGVGAFRASALTSLRDRRPLTRRPMTVDDFRELAELGRDLNHYDFPARQRQRLAQRYAAPARDAGEDVPVSVLRELAGATALDLLPPDVQSRLKTLDPSPTTPPGLLDLHELMDILVNEPY